VRRPPAPGRLPLVTKIVHGLGDWGNTTTSTIFIFFFAFFLTDVARLSSNLAALVLLVGGIWDAVNDPLTAELTDDYDERTEITGWRMATSMLGGLVAAFFVPVIVGVFTRKASGYFVAGAGFGLLAVVPHLMLFFTTKERFAASERPKESLAALFFATLKNRAFRCVAAIYMLSWASVNLVASLLQYYVTYWIRIPDQLENALVVVQGAALACIPLIVLLSGRLGKRGAYALAAGWWGVVILALRPPLDRKEHQAMLGELERKRTEAAPRAGLRDSGASSTSSVPFIELKSRTAFLR